MLGVVELDRELLILIERAGDLGGDLPPEFDSSVGAWARNSVIFQGFRACDGIAPCA